MDVRVLRAISRLIDCSRQPRRIPPSSGAIAQVGSSRAATPAAAHTPFDSRRIRHVPDNLSHREALSIQSDNSCDTTRHDKWQGCRATMAESKETVGTETTVHEPR